MQGPMKESVQESAQSYGASGQERPVIILGAGLDGFLRGDEQAMEAAELTEHERAAYETDQKLKLITDFMDTYDYRRDFGNAKFAVYR